VRVITGQYSFGPDARRTGIRSPAAAGDQQISFRGKICRKSDGWCAASAIRHPTDRGRKGPAVRLLTRRYWTGSGEAETFVLGGFQ